MSIQMPDDDLPRDPAPPERATDVDKQDPATPDSSPEPEASEVESARLLANQARPELGAEGFSDQRIDELASEFIAQDIGEGLEEFLRWARAEGQLPQGSGERKERCTEQDEREHDSEAAPPAGTENGRSCFHDLGDCVRRVQSIRA